MDTSEDKDKNSDLNEHVGLILERVADDPQESKTEIKEEPGTESKSPLLETKTESIDDGEVKTQPTDDNDNNVEVKDEATEVLVKTEEVAEEQGSANNSLVADGAESGSNTLSAPVVAQPKVVMTVQLMELPELKISIIVVIQLPNKYIVGS